MADSSTRTVLFIRHGQSHANKTEVNDASVLDATLTPLGQAQAAYWSENDATRELLQSFDICFCSPLRRAMETASLVFKNATAVPIEVNRFAREKWWFLWQCRGVSHQEKVEYSESLVRDIQKVDTLSEVDLYWNPEQETSTMLDKKTNTFNDQSERGLQKFRQGLRTHSSHRIAVACHWGVIESTLGIEPQNAEMILTELNVSTGEFTVVERWCVPESLSSPSS